MSKQKKRPTVGAISHELMQKAPENQTVIDVQRDMQKEYMDELIACIASWRASHPQDDCYVVVITKNEKLMPNVFRNYFFARFSCPTPDYDQSVFKYHSATEDLEYIWSIPSKDACLHLLDNSHLVHKDELQLLRFVQRFASGDLYKTAKQLNGESELTSEIQH